jgi:hypothetical protein
MSYGSDWPDHCPPESCVDAQCEVVRIVRSVPLVPGDFLSYAEMGKAPHAGKECEARGLSVFGKLDDAKHYAALYPYVGDKFAVGALEPPHGKTLATPRKGNSHVTWWPYSGVDRPALFRVLS